jgi:predicted AAA+ superfamily ATPase
VQEDKIVQRATVEVLNAIYERDFLGFSYGFRPGKSQQLALDALSVGIMRKKVSWLIEAWFPSVRIYHPHPLERVRVWPKEAPLMKGVTESMAGRAAVFQLFPFSVSETPKVSLLKGGFPEVLARPSASQVWFRSYIQTYLERDVRAISSIRDLAIFRRFLSLLASRCGQILNRTDLAAPLGVSVPTISEWLNILEITSQIILISPFYENFGKRLIKSPKLYFADSGLACYLLGIESEKMLSQSPFLGPVFEGFVASEIIKHQVNSGKLRQLYYFRDQQGLEVDFVIPEVNRRLMLLEAKASRTAVPEMAESVHRLTKAISNYDVRSFLIYRPSRQSPPILTLRPGMKALSVEELLSTIAGRNWSYRKKGLLGGIQREDQT